ncbi:MAG: hypothetical protein J6B92_07645 [Paraprevotella sp.]|nr:hypothetical protein [Paraprevotella sp.]MBP3470691.1 hypothetical protein [Paraprevotella sp.]
MEKRKIKKSVWVPLAFVLYSAVLYAVLIPRSDASVREIGITVGVNLLIIVALWFLYRKKEQMAERRERDLSEQEQRKRQ